MTLWRCRTFWTHAGRHVPAHSRLKAINLYAYLLTIDDRMFCFLFLDELKSYVIIFSVSRMLKLYNYYTKFERITKKKLNIVLITISSIFIYLFIRNIRNCYHRIHFESGFNHLHPPPPHN